MSSSLTIPDRSHKIIIIYIDLARAKSEALDNISLFKQNMKLCNVKRQREGQRTVKNNNKSN